MSASPLNRWSVTHVLVCCPSWAVVGGNLIVVAIRVHVDGEVQDRTLSHTVRRAPGRSAPDCGLALLLSILSYEVSIHAAANHEVRRCCGCRARCRPMHDLVRVDWTGVVASSRGRRAQSGDTTLRSGEYSDEYSFEGRVGQRIEFDLIAAVFDPYLIVVAPVGRGRDKI